MYAQHRLRSLLRRPRVGFAGRVVTLFCLALVASCATPATRAVRVAEPAPCADSTYVQLKRQHPDSLSDRSWQRLQSLDRAGAAARAESSLAATNGTTGAGNSGGHLMWVGAVVMMVAMMVAMR